MHYLPKFPLYLNSVVLLGITLLLGIIGGELAKKTRYLPQIVGYLIVGFLIGYGGFGIVNDTILAHAHLFIDVCLSLVLFEAGRCLDFKWLRHDKSILAMSITESALTFSLTYIVLHYGAGMQALPSTLAATIAIATSPAVVMLVALDVAAEGPVSRRALILTSLNNLYALILFIILVPITQSHTLSFGELSSYIAYRLLGATLLGLMTFFIIKILSLLTGKQKESQFILFVGSVLFAIGLANALHLPSMLALFVLGVAARNFDFQYTLMEVDFGWWARVFFIILFVVTGIHLSLQGFWQATNIIIAFIVARIAAKALGILWFSRQSGLSRRQGLALSLTLTPMAGIAIGLSNSLIDFNPDLGNELLVVITAAVAIFNIIGPIATQVAFITAGESLPELSLQGRSA